MVRDWRSHICFVPVLSYVGHTWVLGPFSRLYHDVMAVPWVEACKSVGKWWHERIVTVSASRLNVKTSVADKACERAIRDDYKVTVQFWLRVGNLVWLG